MKQAHINCSREDISPYVIIAGDPKRIDRLAGFLDNPREIAYNREFKTIRGSYKGVEITATSTGIGGPSAAIAIEELIACGAQYIIRLGSCGSAQAHIDLGDLILATGAVREDGASKMYVAENYPAVGDFYLNRILLDLMEERNLRHHVGLVRSHDSFYIDNEEEIMDYYSSKNILGSDMETATLFTLASLRNIRAASLLNNVVLYKEDLRESVNNFADSQLTTYQAEEEQIRLGLETFYRLENKS